MIQESQIDTHDRILRMPEVIRTVGLSRPQLYLMISKGTFPKQIKLTPNGKAAGWLRSEVVGYIQSRVEESRGLAA